jgi:DNA-binding transcriptional ArsR family regulator
LTGKTSLTYSLDMPKLPGASAAKAAAGSAAKSAASSDVEPEVFSAIASPTRRHILDLLAEGDQPVKDIASHFEMSRPAISQHLRILLLVGLVTEQRHGREHRYRLVPENLGPVRDWLAHYERFWDDNFKRLQAHLSKGKRK